MKEPAKPGIRRFDACDLRHVLNIERRSFNSDAWPAEYFQQYGKVCPELFFVAEMERRAVGYSLTIIWNDSAEVASLAVLPRYRRHRIATALLHKTIQMVRKQGAASVWLMVRRDNEAALRLYRKLGFERTSTVRDYYEDGSPAWRMRLLL